MTQRAFPPAQAHGALERVFDDVFFVRGSVAMPGPLPMRFSRSMTVVREGTRLVLINSMRLGDAGLAELDALGEVTDVIRIAGFHGMDDPFYADRYGAKVWAIEGQPYFEGFKYAADAPTYFTPDVWMSVETALPLSGAQLFVIEGRPPEGLLVLEREGGVVVSGDCLQNWARADEFFSLPATLMMKVMGFIKPTNIGPGWLRGAKPNLEHVRRIPQLDFQHVLPAHGAPVIGGAREAFARRIERLR